MESYKEYCRRNNIVPNQELVSIDELEVPVSLRDTQSFIQRSIITLVKTHISNGLSFVDSVYKVQDDLDTNLHATRISIQTWIDSRKVIVNLT